MIFADGVVGRGITATATAENVPVVVCEGSAHTREVPFEDRTCPAVPTVARPVPPDVVAKGVVRESEPGTVTTPVPAIRNSSVLVVVDVPA